MRGTRGITLIALIIIIIVLLILAGIAIIQLTQKELLNNSKLAKIRTEYTSAKEIIEIKLMEIKADCIYREVDFNIKEIAVNIKLDNHITIEKYYNSNINENLNNLNGIVVSVEKYQKYKFLIGDMCEIKGILQKEITETTDISEFKTIDEFEEEILGNKEEKDSKIYLYDMGREFEDITGGWSVGFINGTNPEVGSITKNDKYIEIKTWGYWCGYGMVSIRDIDFTAYTKLCVEFYDTSYSDISGGYDQLAIIYGDKTDIIYTKNIEDKVYEEDISLMNGKSKVTIMGGNGANAKIKSAWLE